MKVRGLRQEKLSKSIFLIEVCYEARRERPDIWKDMGRSGLSVRGA